MDLDPPSTFAGKKHTAVDVIHIIMEWGHFTEEDQILAVLAIAIGESSLYSQCRNWHPPYGYRPANAVIGVQGPPDAWKDGCQMHSDRGMWQISSRWWAHVTDEQCDTPQWAIRHVKTISKMGTDFTPWNTYKHGHCQLRYDQPLDGWPALRPLVKIAML